jgi:proteic killer suppression protein
MCTVAWYGEIMIRTIKHRGLKRLVERDERSGLSAEQLPRIVDVLAHLNMAARPSDLDLPGYHLHALRGEYKGFWSVRISANFRIIFRMENGEVYDVDLVDYH